MSALLRWRMTPIIAFILGLPAAIATMRAFNWAYNYYMNAYAWAPSSQSGAILLPALIVCVAIMVLSILKAPPTDRPLPWRSIDYSYWIVVTTCVVLLCSALAINRHINLLPFLSAAVYTAVMAFIAETAARRRDRCIKSTLYWLLFFRHFPFQQTIGFLMGLMLAAHFLILGLVFPSLAPRVYLGATGPLLLTVLASLGGLTYVATFILSLSSRYEEASIEKVRAEQFKVELITNVSHDIRTPLTSIINYVDLLKGLPITRDDFKEYVRVLENKSARLDTLIGDLMEASKASTGAMSVDLTDVDLTELIGQVAGEFDDRFAEKDLTLVIGHPADPVIIPADSRHLWRILENLFSNVVKYALPGTRVFARTEVRGSDIVFSLKNTSKDPLDLSSEMLTEQFIRGDRARQTEGNGLGLYIAKSLVELMGANLRIRTSGDLFEVEILFSQTDTDADEQEHKKIEHGKLIGHIALAACVLAAMLLMGIFALGQIDRYRYSTVTYDQPYYDETADYSVQDGFAHLEYGDTFVELREAYLDDYWDHVYKLVGMHNDTQVDALGIGKISEALGISSLGQYTLTIEHERGHEDVQDELNEPDVRNQQSDLGRRDEDDGERTVLIFDFEAIFMDVEGLSFRMQQYAHIFFALVGDVDEVRWKVNYDATQLNASVCVEDTREEYGDIRAYGRTPEKLFELLGRVGYFQSR